VCVWVCVCVCFVCWFVHTKRSSRPAHNNTLVKPLFSTHSVCSSQTSTELLLQSILHSTMFSIKIHMALICTAQHAHYLTNMWVPLSIQSKFLIKLTLQLQQLWSFGSALKQTLIPNCIHLLTYSMEQSPSWEANWFAASQEIPRVLWNPKVHYRTHKRPPHTLKVYKINQQNVQVIN
jgi:hypothetical protein